MNSEQKYHVLIRDRELFSRAGRELLRDPRSLIAEGVLYKKGRRGHAARVTLDGKDYFLKQYYSRGGIYRFVDLFRGSRGINAWRINIRMLEAGLAVPRPLVYAEERRWGIWQNGFLLMEFVDGAGDFRHVWARSGYEQRMALACKAGAAIAALHKNRFVHGDLKWYNILCQGEGEHDRLVFSDLDGARCSMICHQRASAVDVTRFLADFAEVEDGEAGRQRFLDAYRATLR